MKKFITILILFLFVFQANIFAQNEVAITGKIIGFSVQDSWVLIEMGKPFTTKLMNFFRNIFSKNDVNNYEQYFFSISGTTNLLDKKGNVFELENLAIGDKVFAKGIMLYEEDGNRFVEATELMFEKQRSFFQAIQEAFTDRREQGQSGIISSNSGVTVSGQPIFPPQQESQNEQECVGEGEPVLTNPLFFAGTNEKKCCKDLILCDSGKNKIINKGGINYIVAGFCRKHCDVEATINFTIDVNKNFDFDFKVNENSFGLPMLPLIASQCRVDLDCYNFGKLVRISVDNLPSSLVKTSVDNLPPLNYVCRAGFCVAEPLSYPWFKGFKVEENQASIITIPGACLYDSDCELNFDGKRCIAADSMTKSFLESLKALFSNTKKECVCVKHICQKIGEPEKLPGLPELDCGYDVLEVCGIDGKTYNNPCEAIKAGTDVKHKGKCVIDKEDNDGSVGFPGMPFPDDDPMVCDGNSECFWCNDVCFTKKMIEDSNMICDANKKMPSDMTCICDGRTKICKVFPKLGVQPHIPTTTVPGRANIPDNICMTDRDCSFCDQQCFTTSIIQKMSLSGNNCNISLKPKNAVCLCQMGTCVVEYTKPPETPIETPVSKTTISNIPGFCGVQTNGYCSNDVGCKVGGCSGTVCQSKNEEPAITICDWQECYQVPLRTYCGCVNNKCMWYQSKTITSSTTLPLIYPPVTNPFLLPPVEGRICLFVMMCLDGKIYNSDCGEIGNNRCYQFHDLGEGNCSCY